MKTTLGKASKILNTSTDMVKRKINSGELKGGLNNPKNPYSGWWVEIDDIPEDSEITKVINEEIDNKPKMPEEIKQPEEQLELEEQPEEQPEEQLEEINIDEEIKQADLTGHNRNKVFEKLANTPTKKQSEEHLVLINPITMGKTKEADSPKNQIKKEIDENVETENGKRNGGNKRTNGIWWF